MRVLRHEQLQHRNTLALKSLANAYVDVCSEEALKEALGWASDHNMSIVTLGQGSNVVLAGDLNALVIHQAQRGIEILQENSEGVVLKVAAGESWHGLVEWCLAQGYFGLENLAFIPGTVGAAPVQNIGAYGVEIAPYILRVNAVRIGDRQGTVLDSDECEFGYRDSIFKGALCDELIITSVELALSKKPQLQMGYPALKDYLDEHCPGDVSPQHIFNAVVDIRKSKLPDPTIEPNAGSFFKNPIVSQGQLQELLAYAPEVPQYVLADGQVKIPAAWLIDWCGWKGKRVGDFGVHPEHALVLVNHGGGDGCDLLALAAEIKRSVFDAYRISLEIEPRVYSFE